MNLKSSIICLHISAVLYALFGVAIFYLAFFFLEKLGTIFMIQKIIFSGYALFCFILAAFVEIVIRGLKKHRYWAWIASIIIFGIYLPSIFIVIGILGLIGLVKHDTKKLFVYQDEMINEETPVETIDA